MDFPPIDDSWYHRPPNLLEEVSAGGIVVRRENRQIFVALIREKGSSHYVLPKGRLEPGESIQAAAHREIAEEAGLTDLHLIDELGMRERLSFSKRRWKKVYYFLFRTNQIHANPQHLEAGNVLAWFPLNQIPQLYWPEQKALIDFNRHRIGQIWQDESLPK